MLQSEENSIPLFNMGDTSTTATVISPPLMMTAVGIGPKRTSPVMVSSSSVAAAVANSSGSPPLCNARRKSTGISLKPSLGSASVQQQSPPTTANNISANRNTSRPLPPPAPAAAVATNTIGTPSPPAPPAPAKIKVKLSPMMMGRMAAGRSLSSSTPINNNSLGGVGGGPATRGSGGMISSLSPSSAVNFISLPPTPAAASITTNTATRSVWSQSVMVATSSTADARASPSMALHAPSSRSTILLASPAEGNAAGTATTTASSSPPTKHHHATTSSAVATAESQPLSSSFGFSTQLTDESETTTAAASSMLATHCAPPSDAVFASAVRICGEEVVAGETTNGKEGRSVPFPVSCRAPPSVPAATATAAPQPKPQPTRVFNAPPPMRPPILGVPPSSSSSAPVVVQHQQQAANVTFLSSSTPTTTIVQTTATTPASQRRSSRRVPSPPCDGRISSKTSPTAAAASSSSPSPLPAPTPANEADAKKKQEGAHAPRGSPTSGWVIPKAALSPPTSAGSNDNSNKVDNKNKNEANNHKTASSTPLPNNNSASPSAAITARSPTGSARTSPRVFVVPPPPTPQPSTVSSLSATPAPKTAAVVACSDVASLKSDKVQQQPHEEKKGEPTKKATAAQQASSVAILSTGSAPVSVNTAPKTAPRRVSALSNPALRAAMLAAGRKPADGGAQQQQQPSDDVWGSKLNCLLTSIKSLLQNGPSSASSAKNVVCPDERATTTTAAASTTKKPPYTNQVQLRVNEARERQKARAVATANVKFAPDQPLTSIVVGGNREPHSKTNQQTPEQQQQPSSSSSSMTASALRVQEWFVQQQLTQAAAERRRESQRLVVKDVLEATKKQIGSIAASSSSLCDHSGNVTAPQQQQQALGLKRERSADNHHNINHHSNIDFSRTPVGKMVDISVVSSAAATPAQAARVRRERVAEARVNNEVIKTMFAHLAANQCHDNTTQQHQPQSINPATTQGIASTDTDHQEQEPTPMINMPSTIVDLENFDAARALLAKRAAESALRSASAAAAANGGGEDSITSATSATEAATPQHGKSAAKRTPHRSACGGNNKRDRSSVKANNKNGKRHDQEGGADVAPCKDDTIERAIRRREKRKRKQRRIEREQEKLLQRELFGFGAMDGCGSNLSLLPSSLVMEFEDDEEDVSSVDCSEETDDDDVDSSDDFSSIEDDDDEFSINRITDTSNIGYSSAAARRKIRAANGLSTINSANASKRRPSSSSTAAAAMIPPSSTALPITSVFEEVIACDKLSQMRRQTTVRHLLEEEKALGVNSNEGEVLSPLFSSGRSISAVANNSRRQWQRDHDGFLSPTSATVGPFGLLSATTSAAEVGSATPSHHHHEGGFNRSPLVFNITAPTPLAHHNQQQEGRVMNGFSPLTVSPQAHGFNSNVMREGKDDEALMMSYTPSAEMNLEEMYGGSGGRDDNNGMKDNFGRSVSRNGSNAPTASSAPFAVPLLAPTLSAAALERAREDDRSLSQALKARVDAAIHRAQTRTHHHHHHHHHRQHQQSVSLSQSQQPQQHHQHFVSLSRSRAHNGGDGPNMKANNNNSVSEPANDHLCSEDEANDDGAHQRRRRGVANDVIDDESFDALNATVLDYQGAMGAGEDDDDDNAANMGEGGGSKANGRMSAPIVVPATHHHAFYNGSENGEGADVIHGALMSFASADLLFSDDY